VRQDGWAANYPRRWRQVDIRLWGADIVGDNVTRLDIGDFFEATHKLVGELSPDVVVHPAGWTDVDGCYEDPDKAIAINGLARSMSH